ncbi:hypothetical protein EMIHUDRAFT_360027, partial [Emiliania huxleyi CCMP1516]|uniref:Uncharacterized protein n=2 Tax=Emiliania huxleyi TaxID=2903 RepID=A0A0D3I1S1_EMIH1
MLLELGLLPDVAMARQDSGRLARFAAIFPETRRMASEIEEFADIEEALRCGYRYFGAGGFFGEKRRGLAEFSIAAKITTALCPAADGTLRVGHAGKLGDFSEGSWADSFGREARRDGARQSSSPLRRSRVAWDFSAPLGSSRLLSAPLGSSRLLSAPLGSSRLLSAPLGSSRLLSGHLGRSSAQARAKFIVPAEVDRDEMFARLLGYARAGDALHDAATAAAAAGGGAAPGTLLVRADAEALAARLREVGGAEAMGGYAR